MRYLRSKQSATRQHYKINTLYSSTKWRNFRAAILAEQGGQCVACGNTYPDYLLHIDHITPIANGGSVWDINNLQVLCKACHGKKTINEKIHGGGG